MIYRSIFILLLTLISADSLLAANQKKDSCETDLVSETTVWGKWDCKQCRLTGISAEPIVGRDQLSCPNCGSLREDNEPFYLGHEVTGNGEIINPNVVDTPEEETIAKSGPDWICQYCKVAVRDVNSQCDHCGADRPESGVRIAQALPSQEILGPSAQIPSVMNSPLVRRESAVTPPAGHHVQIQHSSGLGEKGSKGKSSSTPFIQPEKSNGSVARSTNIVSGLVGVGATAAIVGGLWWGFKEHPVQGVVSHGHWSHSIERQTFVPVSRRDWRRNIPSYPSRMPVNGSGELSGADNVSNCASEHSHDENYVCGTENYTTRESYSVPGQPSCRRVCRTRNNRNGSFTNVCSDVCTPTSEIRYRNVTHTRSRYCSRPIFETRCSYTSFAWSSNGTLNTSGGLQLGSRIQQTALEWPAMPVGPRDRVLRMESYSVNISYRVGSEDHTYTINPQSEREFISWRQNDVVTLMRNNFGTVTSFRRGR